MSASLGGDDFYQNLLQYLNQNTRPSLENTVPSSASPHEAEKHALEDESINNESDSKRREPSTWQIMDPGSDETDTKPTKKKPGRKMVMIEPADKRKAQNRAAQRAFRERREAHVKTLESRVNELEELTQSKDVENQGLKNQIQELEAELMQLRGSKFDFNFTVKTTSALAGDSPPRNPFQQNNQSQQIGQNEPSPSSGNITDSSIFLSGQSSLATSPENDSNKNATPNIDIPFEIFLTNSTGPANNNSNYLSPLFPIDVFGNSPTRSNNSEPVSIFGRNTQINTPLLLDSFASPLTSFTQNQTPRTSSSGFNTSVPSSTSIAPLSTFTPNSNNNLFDMNDPLFNTWRDNSMPSNGDDNSFDIFDTMFTSMSPGAFTLVDSAGLTEFVMDSPVNLSESPQQVQNVIATGEPYLTCSEFWEQVTNHPKFDELDIDQLCVELKSKAKCSNSGPGICPRDVNETISRFVKS